MIRFGLSLTLLACLCGCSYLPAMPRLPKRIQTPTVEVESVQVIHSTPEGTSLAVVLLVTNPNDTPLPLGLANYRLAVGGGAYQGQTTPAATLSAGAQIRLRLPAAISGAITAGAGYDLSGSIQIRPPGQGRQVIYAAGVPRPRLTFSATGQIGSEPQP